MRTKRGIGSVMTGLLLVACCSAAATAAAQTPWFAAQLAGDREAGSPGDAVTAGPSLRGCASRARALP